MGAHRTFVHFLVAGDRLGVSLDEVGEIFRLTRVTPVPRAPGFILGVANIRGRVVTLLDAERLFGPTESAEGEDAPPARLAPGGHAVVLAPPREHLAIYARGRVDIGKGRESAPGGPGASGAPASRPGRAPLEGLVVMGDEVVHLIPTQGLQSYCDSRIVERYRRRA